MHKYKETPQTSTSMVILNDQELVFSFSIKIISTIWLLWISLNFHILHNERGSRGYRESIEYTLMQGTNNSAKSILLGTWLQDWLIFKSYESSNFSLVSMTSTPNHIYSIVIPLSRLCELVGFSLFRITHNQCAH